METDRVAGAVIVSASHSDLGDAGERDSGYFSRPWQWDQIRANSGQFLIQFHSSDDPLVPADEARHVAKQTANEYIEYTDRGHFMSRTFPELLEVLRAKMKK